ncbi:MAG: hypothetical protein VST72_02090 [Nitrospirota bacterium]|nr:hypothetical protein [Nitrospirota bacterium]
MKNSTPHTAPKYIIYVFFVVGLLSAVAFRAIIVFQHIEPRWVRPVWYIGVVGYFIFFLYRYIITKKRKKAIEDFQLIEKVKANACLKEEDRDIVLFLLSSIRYSPEDINYAVIFILSVLAIIADLALTAIK